MTNTDKLAEARTYSDSPGWQELVDRQERTAADKPSDVPECPEWCVLPAGHPYAGTLTDDERTCCRDHVSSNGTLPAWVWQEERNREGVVTTRPPTIHLDADVDGDMDADEALELAGALLEAARLQQKIRATRVAVEAFKHGAAAAQEVAGLGCDECGATGIPLVRREVIDDDGHDRTTVWECLDAGGCFRRLDEQRQGKE